MEPNVKGWLAVITVVVATGLAVLAIKSGKFGSKAQKLTDGGDKLVSKVADVTKKVTG